MFKRFFQKQQSNGLSKLEYWRKWELFELFDDLHLAESLLTELEAGSLGHDNKFMDFKNAYLEELYEIEGDNVADFTRIWQWFAPGKEWHTIIGLTGQELGDRIFKRVDRWKSSSARL